MSLFRIVAKNTLAQGLGRAVALLFSLVITAFLTRLLGVSGYGNYVFILSLVMFFVAIADWGTGIIFVRESSRNDVEEKRFFGNAFLFRTTLAILFLLLINVLIFFVPALYSLSSAVKISSLLMLLVSLKTSCHIIFQARLKFHFMALTDIAISLSFFLLLLLFFNSLMFAPGLPSVILVFVLANLLGTILAIVFALNLAKFDFRPDREILRKIIFEAMPTGALLFTFSIYNRLDIFLLQAFKGSEAVGIYGLAYKVHDNLILGAAFLTASLFPIISGMVGKPEQKERLKLIYRKVFDLLFAAGLFVLIVIFILAPIIINMIAGPIFTGSVLVLRILVFATIVAYFNHLTGYMLIALGKQKVSLIIAILALVWNLGLNIIFIPHFSYLAAAVITIATEGLVLILTSFYLARNFSFFPSIGFPKTLVELFKTRGKIF